MFQTKVEIPTSDLNITYQHRVMTLGSCFAENIGKKMQDVYFDMDINPFGVLYNPVSIQKSIEILINNKQFARSDLFENRGLWQSFSHSSLFSDTSADSCLNKINDRLQKASSFLNQTDFCLLLLELPGFLKSKRVGAWCLIAISFQRATLNDGG
jgi:hypothetical protein